MWPCSSTRLGVTGHIERTVSRPRLKSRALRRQERSSPNQVLEIPKRLHPFTAEQGNIPNKSIHLSSTPQHSNACLEKINDASRERIQEREAYKNA